MLGEAGARELGAGVSPLAVSTESGNGSGNGNREYPIAGGPGLAQVGARPLGAETGAPPWARFRTYQVIPTTAVGVAGQQATLVVEGDKQSRFATFIAPAAAFSIFIGDAGISNNPGSNGMALPAGIPYTVELPGNQTVYAVTDAPVFLPLRVNIAPVLIGDRERRF
jgi:hypothetical protein